MAHKGPILPRKATGIARSDESFRSVAFQIGTLLAIERNRVGWTQEQIAEHVGIGQVDVSRAENGLPLSQVITDEQITGLFDAFDLPQRQANFLMWWRDNQ